MCPGALGTKATDWKTVLFYAGAGTVSAGRSRNKGPLGVFGAVAT
jgi:hypothetical protein